MKATERAPQRPRARTRSRSSSKNRSLEDTAAEERTDDKRTPAAEGKKEDEKVEKDEDCLSKEQVRMCACCVVHACCVAGAEFSLTCSVGRHQAL